MKFSEIIIEDDGPGYPKDVINKIGEPYIRKSSNKRMSSTKSGLGLGIFIGKTLIGKKSMPIVEFLETFRNKSKGAVGKYSLVTMKDLKRI